MAPDTVEAFARAHERQVRETQKLYGQRSGTDQPNYEDDRHPLEGLVAAVADLIDRAFDIFIIALVIFMVIGLTLSTAPRP